MKSKRAGSPATNRYLRPKIILVPKTLQKQLFCFICSGSEGTEIASQNTVRIEIKYKCICVKPGHVFLGAHTHTHTQPE